MPSKNIVHNASIFGLTFVVAFHLSFLSGCKSNSGPTAPFDAPSYPSMAGHWVGSGSYFDGGWGKRLNIDLAVDFPDRTENTFAGDRTGFNTTNGAGVGSKLIWGSKGTVTMSKQVTITDTSGIYMTPSGQVTILTGLPVTWGPCTLSANGDTLRYSGPSPESEVFVLVKQH
jgi:hypothetical protein